MSLQVHDANCPFILNKKHRENGKTGKRIILKNLKETKMNRFFKKLVLLASVSAVLAGAVPALTAGKELKLSAKERKELNTFFSNFSEVFVEPFTRDSIKDSDLIRFSVSHNYINNIKLFSKGGKEYQVKISASNVDASVMKFFGRKITKHQSVDDDGIEYRDGWYYKTDASGEELSFSQVASLSDEGNGTYTAIVNVYIAGSGWTGDINADEKTWKKESPDDVPVLTWVMKATLRKVTEKGKSRYILVEYIKIR